MCSSLSNIRELWEQCIMATMYLRGLCRQRPSLYYTDSGSLVLDSRPFNRDDIEIVVAITYTCNLIAGEYGYYQDDSVDVDDLSVWVIKK